MTALAPRRAFLQGLTSLPIGGAVALVAPVACIPALATEHGDVDLLRLCQHSTTLVGQYNAITDPEENVPDGLWEQIDDTNERIRRLPATTMEGLVAKAEIMRWEACLVPDRNQPAADWDWDVKCLDGFIQELRAFGRIASLDTY